jgi:hypothetical protein
MSSTSWAVLFFFKATTGRSGLVVWIIDRRFSKIKTNGSDYTTRSSGLNCKFPRSITLIFTFNLVSKNSKNRVKEPTLPCHSFYVPFMKPTSSRKVFKHMKQFKLFCF